MFMVWETFGSGSGRFRFQPVPVPSGSGSAGSFSSPGSAGSVQKRFGFRFSGRFAGFLLRMPNGQLATTAGQDIGFVVVAGDLVFSATGKTIFVLFCFG